MRGRRPKSAELKEAQGNPGKRRLPPRLAVEEKPLPGGFPFKVSADGRLVFDLVAPQLRSMNVLRGVEEIALWRYCDTMARYWRVTEKINKGGGETYKMKNVNGDEMLRLNPLFIVQERLGKRLDTLEAKFALTPLDRQQYMLAIARGSLAPPELPLPMPASAETISGDDDAIGVVGAIH